MERFSEATALYRELMLHHANDVGPDHRFTLRAATNVGVSLIGCDLFLEAVDVLQRAYDGWSRTLGAHDINTLRTADNLAEAFTGAHRYKEAHELASRTLRIRIDIAQFPFDHPETLATLYQIGISQVSIDPNRAREVLTEVLTVRRQVLGSEHPDTLAAGEKLRQLGI
jgi:hypothetical protein